MINTPNPYKHLYDIPIEQLNLSDDAVKVLKKRAIASVGDCIDFYNRSIGTMIVMVPPFGGVMKGEVAQKIKEQGYWIYVKEED